MKKFSLDKISDQKRLARGEQWLFVRSFLRAWHKTHRSNWRIMTLAGGYPDGEISAIKDLMSEAHIIALDREQSCVEAAITAGAAEGERADLAEWCGRQRKHSLDVINLDFCSGASAETKDLILRCLPLVARPGALMVTFSYGRDVVEFFRHRVMLEERLVEVGVPDAIAARIRYLFADSTRKIQSVITYIGNEMPMCSVVLPLVGPGAGNRHVRKDKCSFVKLQQGDFELAVVHPDVSRLYDCPKERIESIRKRQIALKAVETRRVKQKQASLL